MSVNNRSLELQNNCPKPFSRFVYESDARFPERSHAGKSLEIQNKQDRAKTYTVEFENHKHLLNFLDINTTDNNANKKYESKVHRNDTITNIHIKPNSCTDLSITKSVFKGFPHQIHTMYLKKYNKKQRHLVNR